MRPAYGLDLRRIFVDTSAHFALIDGTDTNHADALRVGQRLRTERWRMFTTNFIVAETHALILTRLGRRAAALALEEIDAGAITVVQVSAGDEQRAREIIRRYTDKDFSLTDATSFAEMVRLRIAQAFSFDSDFHSTPSR